MTAKARLLLGLGDARARSGDMRLARDAFLRRPRWRASGLGGGPGATAALGFGGRIVWGGGGGPSGRKPARGGARALGTGPALRARVLARLAGALRDERDPTRASTWASRRSPSRAGRRRRRSAWSGCRSRWRGWPAHSTAWRGPRRRWQSSTSCSEQPRTPATRRASARLMTPPLVNAERNEIDSCEAMRASPGWRDELRSRRAVVRRRGCVAAGAPTTAASPRRKRRARAALEIGGPRRGRGRPPRTHPHADPLTRAGSPAEAYDELSRMAAAFPARVLPGVPGRLCVELGRDVEARRLFEELAPNDFEVVPRDDEWLVAAALPGGGMLRAGRRHRAAMLYEELEPRAGRGAINVAEGSVGTLARAVGGTLRRCWVATPTPSGSLARRSSSTTAGGGRPWSAHARVQLAAVLARQGDDDESARLLDEAAATAEELGMVALATRIAARPAGALADGLSNPRPPRGLRRRSSDRPRRGAATCAAGDPAAPSQPGRPVGPAARGSLRGRPAGDCGQEPPGARVAPAQGAPRRAGPHAWQRLRAGGGPGQGGRGPLRPAARGRASSRRAR